MPLNPLLAITTLTPPKPFLGFGGTLRAIEENYGWHGWSIPFPVTQEHEGRVEVAGLAEGRCDGPLRGGAYKRTLFFYGLAIVVCRNTYFEGVAAVRVLLYPPGHAATVSASCLCAE